METQEDLLPQFLRSNLLLIFAAVGGLIFLGYGLYQISIPKDSDEIVIQKASEEKSIAPSLSSNTTVIIDVEGAVQKPGVYTIPSGARVQDAIAAAGGLSAKAAKIELAKNLNLASRVVDGMKLYIPFQGESVVQAGSQAVAGAQSGVVSVNTGSATQLEGLPGIGEVTAEKIINNRPYASLEELVSKKAISAKMLDKIRDQISL